MFRLFPAVLLACTVLFPCQPSQAAPMLTVESFRWTNAVDPVSRGFDLIHKTPVHAKSIVLWMQLQGSKELLQKLRTSTTGALPVKYVWYRVTTMGILGEDAVLISVGKKDDLQKLSYEVDANGFFRWRIWSSKALPSTGLWRADLLYANNEPVLCGADDDEQPCRFEIEVI
jgi:hypothetical protein